MSCWSWFKKWETGAQLPVVFCPRDCEIATGYAPSFEGAIYWLLLEEMSSSWLVEQLEITPEQLGVRFQQYTEWVAPYLPKTWASTLYDLSRRPVNCDKWKCHFLLTHDEAKELIASDLAFEHLDEEFKHYRD